MQANITEHIDYRNIIKERSKPKGLTFKSLAENCAIHTSYFSRVMMGKADFSDEQLYLIGKTLLLRDWEIDYFLLLGDFARSGNMKHKDFLLEKIEEMQKHKQKVGAQLQDTHTNFPENYIELYYEEALTAKIHMHLTIERFRKNPDLLTKKLGISKTKLDSELRKLKFLHLIKEANPGVELLKTHVHLDESHPASPNNHINWRLESIGHISKRACHPTDYHLSVAFGSNEKIKKELKELFKKYVIQAQKIVKENPATESEDIYFLNMDLY